MRRLLTMTAVSLLCLGATPTQNRDFGRRLESEARELRQEAKRLHREALDLLARSAERERTADLMDAQAAAKEHHAQVLLRRPDVAEKAAHYRRWAAYLERVAERDEQRARIARASAQNALQGIEATATAMRHLREVSRSSPQDVVRVHAGLELLQKHILELQRRQKLDEDAAARYEANARKLRERAARWRAQASLMK